MTASRRKLWIREALLVSVVYCAIGRLFVMPDTHAQAWRLAAWIVSGVVFAAHIRYEHFKLRGSTRTIAWHVATAVAIGAFLLSGAAALHSLWVQSAIRPLWLLALVAWPVITAVPAFGVALIVSKLLARFRPNSEAK